MLSCDSAARGGICDVYLVGTNHLSLESWREVRDVIKFLQPQVVFLELCSSRTRILNRKDVKVALGRGELVKGAEFFVANEEARKYGGEVILGDRPQYITVQRARAKTPLSQKTTLNKLAKKMMEMDVESETRKMQSRYPTLVKTIVDERDQ